MKFTEEQLTKIRESLLANGIPEEEIEQVIADLQKGEEEKGGDPTEKSEEGNPEEPSASDDNPPAEDVGNDEGEPAPAVEPPVEELPPVPTEDDVVLPVPEEEPVPPVEEPVPPVEEVPAAPAYDDSELRSLCEELKAANDGLLARIDSLEEALKKAGILDDSEVTPVGDESNPSAPANLPDDDPIDDILRQINGKKY